MSSEIFVPEISELNHDDYGQPLVCSGCAHSASGQPFPGCPSGERPCCFCVRNINREEDKVSMAEQGHGLPETWYDDSKPVSVPMDCYCSLDMKQQYREWLERARSDG